MGEGIFVGAIIGALIGVIVYLFLKGKQSSSSSEETTQQKYEIDSLRELIGSMQTLLGSKEKEITDRDRRVEELKDQLNNAQENNRHILSLKKSSEIRTGHIVEHMAPLLLEALGKYKARNLKWFGQPVDYIAYEDDGIYFIEVKSGKSSLSYNQKKFKNLVLNKKVYWDEVRFRGTKKKK